MKRTIAKIESLSETLYFTETIKNTHCTYSVHYIVDEFGKTVVCETTNFLEAELAFMIESVNVFQIVADNATVSDVQTAKIADAKLRLYKMLEVAFNTLQP